MAQAQAQVSGRALVDGAPVSWGSVSADDARGAGVAAPLSLLMFTFPVKVAGSAVSEADWQREAALHGTDIRTLRMILGDAVYLAADGRLASCTMKAISDGLCGKPRILSVETRSNVARTILEQSGKCAWTGFDAALHQRMAQSAGAEDATLWVAADCR